MEPNGNQLDIYMGFKLNVFQIFALVNNKISDITYKTSTLNGNLIITLYGTKPIFFNTMKKRVKIGSYIVSKSSESNESRLLFEKVDTYMTRANMYDKQKSNHISNVFFTPIKYAIDVKAKKNDSNLEDMSREIQDSINDVFKSAIEFSKYDTETDKVFTEPVNEIIAELEKQFD